LVAGSSIEEDPVTELAVRTKQGDIELGFRDVNAERRKIHKEAPTGIESGRQEGRLVKANLVNAGSSSKKRPKIPYGRISQVRHRELI
jgi:hypothetical protein